MGLVLVLLLLLNFVPESSAGACPCEEAPIEYRSVATHQVLCVSFEKGVKYDGGLVEKVKQSMVKESKDSGIEKIVFLEGDQNSNSGEAECNIIFHLFVDHKRSETSRHARIMCPGKCEATPELSLPIDWFTGSSVEFDISEDINLSCSLSLFQFLRGYGMKLSEAAEVPLAGPLCPVH